MQTSGEYTWTRPELSAGPPGTKLLHTSEPEGSVPNTMPHPHSSCHGQQRHCAAAPSVDAFHTTTIQAPVLWSSFMRAFLTCSCRLRQLLLVSLPFKHLHRYDLNFSKLHVPVVAWLSFAHSGASYCPCQIENKRSQTFFYVLSCSPLMLLCRESSVGKPQ